jgi:4-aminobutyrate--pyruvate transaminase
MSQVPSPNSAAGRDIAYLVHPYTNIREHEKIGPLVIERGQGIYVYDDQGKEYIEGLAGLWSVAVGFGEDRLVRAATEQLKKLPFYHIFVHKSHGPAIDLSERLIAMTPDRLRHVSFTNSGSEANDTAVKLVWFYNNARGRPAKKKIIGRNRGYHGITVAAASLTGLPNNHRSFDVPLPGFLHVTCPHHYRLAKPNESEQAFATRLAAELEEVILREGPETVAAFIGEPVMAAGGVIVPPAGYWTKVQEVCRKHDILIIADEVITGFGRLGQPFGSNVFSIDPDIMVLSKQITSSYQPLSAVLFSEEIYQHIADETARIGTFGHGFTASGHPVAAAVALENIRIIEEDRLVENSQAMGTLLHDLLRGFADHPLVGEIRGLGLIAGVELVADRRTKRAFEPAGAVGAAFFRHAQAHGLIIRAIGDTIALSPPLIIKPDQVKELVARFRLALEETLAWSRQHAS